MKVLLVNGGPHKEGNTHAALSEIARQLEQDAEGLQTMRTLARNMAFMLKCKQVALESGVSMPEREKSTFTNFIR